jgi:hypothetical protein
MKLVFKNSVEGSGKGDPQGLKPAFLAALSATAEQVAEKLHRDVHPDPSG